MGSRQWAVGSRQWAVGSRNGIDFYGVEQWSSQLFDEFAYQLEALSEVAGVRTETDPQVLAH